MLLAAALALVLADEGAAAPSLSEATKSLAQLDAALEVGVLRPQYAELMQKHLPAALALAKAPPPDLHPDAADAVRQAVEAYQQALRAWSIASMSWARARANMAYANSVAVEPLSQKETPETRTTAPGETARGRLGVGDAIQDPEILGGQYVDRFELTIQRAGKYTVAAACPTCDAVPVLGDAGGKPITKFDSDLATGVRTYKLKPGGYRLAVSCALNVGRAVGRYELSVQPVP